MKTMKYVCERQKVRRHVQVENIFLFCDDADSCSDAYHAYDIYVQALDNLWV